MASLLGRKGNDEADGILEQKPHMVLSHSDRMKLAAIATIALVVLAAALTLAVHRGATALQRCRNIILSTPRDTCLMQLANFTANTSVCSYIASSQARDSCVGAVALRSENASECYTGGASAQESVSCTSEVALAANDIADCSLIDNATAMSNCIYSLAGKNGFDNLTYCNAMPDKTQSAYCGSIYYYRTAMSTLNSTYCTMLPDNTSNSTPLYLLLGNFSNSSAGLSGYGGLGALSKFNVTDQEICYYNLAVKTMNQSLCAETSGMINTLCSDLSSAANLASLNSSPITPATALASCSIAGLTGSLLNDCVNYVFVGAAATRHNETYCGYINNATIKAQCISGATNSSA